MTSEHPVEIFDVTIRDGSYAVDFQFNREDVRFLYPLLERIGFRYIEIGHGLGLDASSKAGVAAATDDDYLAVAAACRTTSKFGTFFIPGIGDRDSLRRAREEYGMDFVRIGRDADKIQEHVDVIAYAKELGFEVMCNFMKSYTITPAQFAATSKTLVEAGADVIYVVDSAGGMIPSEVGPYFRALRDEVGVRTGFHAHNNLELAVANSLTAMENGCTLIDCSVGGLGRSAGNTRTELMIPALKSMGVPSDYDFLEVMRVWEHVIAPIIKRRELGPTQVAGGYALVHSGLMAPFRELAERLDLRLEALLTAWADATRVGGGEADLEALAQSLSERPDTASLVPEPSELLTIDKEHADPYTIRNSYRSVGQVFEAARTLSAKAYLPIVAAVSLDPYPAEESFVTAEYLYHDEHFVVLRLLFGSIEGFTQTLQEHGECLEALILDHVSPAIYAELVGRRADWHRGQAVYQLDLARLRVEHLFTALQQAALASNAERVLLFGGDPLKLNQRLPRALESLAFHRAHARPFQQLEVSPAPLFGASQPPVTPETRFALAVALTGMERLELEGLVARLADGATVIDCGGSLAFHTDLLEGRALRVVPLPLEQAYSGELLRLQAIPGLTALPTSTPQPIGAR